MSDHRASAPPHLAFDAATARRVVPGWLRATTTRRSLAAATSVVPAVLAEVEPSVPGASSWQPGQSFWTSTGTAVVLMFAPGAEAATAALRLTSSGRDALRRDDQVMAALSAVPLPEDVRALIPQRLAAGQVGPWGYVLDSALPGQTADLMVGRPGWATLQAQALTAVAALHTATARPLTVDDAVLGHWVDEPMAVLARVGAQRAKLARLRDLLAGELGGRTVLASWVHGDFWAGNLLFTAPDRLTGLVDWDLASADELPVHDYLHLLLYQRRAVTGGELGDLVRSLYRHDGWTAGERAALRGSDWSFPDGAPPMGVLLLLQWLRHVAAVSVQQRRYVTHSVRVWERRNVHRVLGSL